MGRVIRMFFFSKFWKVSYSSNFLELLEQMASAQSLGDIDQNKSEEHIPIQNNTHANRYDNPAGIENQAFETEVQTSDIDKTDDHDE